MPIRVELLLSRETGEIYYSINGAGLVQLLDSNTSDPIVLHADYAEWAHYVTGVENNLTDSIGETISVRTSFDPADSEKAPSLPEQWWSTAGSVLPPEGATAGSVWQIANPDELAYQGRVPADGDIAIFNEDATTVAWALRNPEQMAADAAPVQSVNGQTGDVSLDAADVGADPAGTAAGAVSAHVAATDPHGDRSYADNAVAALTGTVAAYADLPSAADHAGRERYVTAARSWFRSNGTAWVQTSVGEFTAVEKDALDPADFPSGMLIAVTGTGAGIYRNTGSAFSLFADTGGGGGGGVPTITVNTVINVPSDLPTINDALDWVRARVRLNGAIVTINVDGTAYTANEQVNVNAEDLSFVNIVATAPVTIDTTGFVAGSNLYALPFFLSIENAKIGIVSGDWIKSGPSPCLFIEATKYAEAHITGVVDSFEVGVYCDNSHVFIRASTIQNILGPAIFGENGGQVFADNLTVSNGASDAILVRMGTSLVVSNSSLSATLAAIIGLRANITVSNSTITTAGDDSMRFTDCVVNVQLAALTCDPVMQAITVADSISDISIYMLNAANTAGNANLLFVSGGQTSLRVNITGASGPSSGLAVLAVGAAIVNTPSGAALTAIFSGGFQPIALTPDPAGLIIA